MKHAFFMVAACLLAREAASYEEKQGPGSAAEAQREKRDIAKSILEDMPGIQLAFTGTGAVQTIDKPSDLVLYEASGWEAVTTNVTTSTILQKTIDAHTCLELCRRYEMVPRCRFVQYNFNTMGCTAFTAESARSQIYQHSTDTSLLAYSSKRFSSWPGMALTQSPGVACINAACVAINNVMDGQTCMDLCHIIPGCGVVAYQKLAFMCHPRRYTSDNIFLSPTEDQILYFS
ncbi:hypothetical protein RvY_13542 [Ramazzottius varieornatus]|uniref:Apple domain-containing protein n=1 Tax=Ramazzottius varieornatus TaxID=947166 RepID=A0A1D1VN84_RAMVA|nr:hypothetical protein RvY_13542 [Ramazzottius varieornatus]